MAYNSADGKRPIEYASKINHSAIIKSKEIKQFLDDCDVLNLDLGKHVMPLGNSVMYGMPKNIKYIFTVDGSYNETFINKKFPSVALAYFNIGVLSFEMKDYDAISSEVVINPEHLKKLKEVSKTTFAIPTQNLSRKGVSSFSDSVRKTISEIFSNSNHSSLKMNDLNDTLAWLIFEKWGDGLPFVAFKCPQDSCDGETNFSFSDRVKVCPKCEKDIYLGDFIRLHALITEPTGASGIVSFLCSVVEQLYIFEIIKHFYYSDRSALNEIVFIKDGPLAFFSKTFLLCEKSRKLINFLYKEGVAINYIGLEKSGSFVDHAILLKDKLKVGKYYIFNDDYIRKYVKPQSSDSFYGFNTYYGKKVMFKTEQGDVLIGVIPVIEYKGENLASELINPEVCLNTVSKLRCNMYDNSLVPISLINKLVSIAALPSANILETFTKQAFHGQKNTYEG